MGFSDRTNFVFKHEQRGSKDSISILRADLKPFCVVNYDHSWKMPKMWGDVEINRRVRSTDVRLEGEDGLLIGEIHEIPTGTLRLIRKWEIFDKSGIFKGIVSEKPKFIGSDWVLESVEGTVLASVEGDRKKHSYEVVAMDINKRAIARCSGMDTGSFNLEIIYSNIDSFLVLCYAIILDLAKTPAVIKRGIL